MNLTTVEYPTLSCSSNHYTSKLGISSFKTFIHKSTFSNVSYISKYINLQLNSIKKNISVAFGIVGAKQLLSKDNQ